MKTSPPRCLVPGTAGWPALLSQGVHPDVEQLWVLGRDPGSMGECVAIVGARNCTPYGIRVARSIAADLAARGICIVSGLARGIDAAAHDGALSVGGETIAVLAGGVDRPYPMASRRLYERIGESGSVVSERRLGETGYKKDFPVRNRIIAGLSKVVVVVQGLFIEGGKKSGAVITANRAHEFGRDVLAVPGDINSAMSAGPHQLIRDNTAGICVCADDVLETLHPGSTQRKEALPLPKGISTVERAIMVTLTRAPSRIDQIIGHTKLDIAEVNRTLTGLELRRWIARDAAGYYRRIL